MAKTRAATGDHPDNRELATRDGLFIEKKHDAKAVRREVLFPTERSTIGRKKIDRAVERVISRKK